LNEITLAIGSDIRCSDGFLGEVRGLVVDPVARTVTHLVVEPKGRSGLARLVPMDLVDTKKGQVGLSCTEAEFKDLGPAEETLAEFVPGYDGAVQLLTPGWQDAGSLVAEGGTIPRIPETETIGIIPAGEVEERRGDHVHATDGSIGQLRALRIDPDNRKVTRVVIKEGHLGAHKEVAIPFDQVTSLDDGIRLSITKQQVRDLPRADTDHTDE
jgi:sporulation protein YlmC with PRC-barrel domain